MKKIQLIEKTIDSANQLVRIAEELDRGFDRLTGISCLDNIGLDSNLTSSFVDGKELFPKNFEVLFLQTNEHVAPDGRFFSLDTPAKGNRIEIEFQDGGSAPAYPYQLKIYLRLEN